jgi:hypothetical protein
MSPEQPGRFTVSWNRVGMDKASRLGAAARLLGLGVVWATNLRRILDLLETDPRDGDPMYRLPALKLLVHRAIVDRVEVLYAVHETQWLVFVIDLIPRFGHPLEDRT